MNDKKIEIIECIEYTVVDGDYYVDGTIEPNIENGFSISVTSESKSKEKSQMKNLCEAGIPFHRDDENNVIIDCNLIINGGLTSYPIP